MSACGAKGEAEEKDALELVYFNCEGRAGPIRNAFAYGGIDYTDTRLTGAEFREKVKATVPNGQLPILKVNGKVFAESIAITRWACMKVGLYPKSPDGLDVLECESLTETITNAFNAIQKTIRMEAGEKKAAREKLIAEDGNVGKAFKRCNEILSKQKKFLLGEKPTMCDLVLFALTARIVGGFFDNIPSTLIKKYSELEKHRISVAGLEGIAKRWEDCGDDAKKLIYSAKWSPPWE